MRPAVVLLLIVGALARPAAAQVNGSVSLMYDVFPDLDQAAGNQHAGELRARLFAERRDEIGEHLRVNLAGHVDGLLADRAALGTRGATADAVARPLDVYVEVVGDRVEVRAGMSRIVWGRLDEFQPTDVVNPIDLSRFVFEGRSEARLPVALVRGRLFLPASSTIEALLVPAFRAGRFDQLGEQSSPFNLARVPVPVRREEPAFGAASLQGGVRFTSTVRRVDWGLSAYRGFRTFPTVTLDAAAGVVHETFPRFTMLGADFETVHGAWGVRGEAAAFVDDELQSTRAARGVPGRSIDSGLGVDRRAGDYRVAANLLLSWRGADAADAPFAADEELNRTDVSFVIAADRSFAQETRTLRLLTLYDPGDGAVFARVIAAASLRDDIWVDVSAGLFAGASPDTIGRLTRRDFLYARMKVFF